MKYIVTYIFLNFSILLASSQSYLTIDSTKIACIYLYEFVEDSTNEYSKKSEEMILQIGNRISKFTSVNKLYADSVIQANDIGNPTIEGFQKIQNLTSGSSAHSYCRNYVFKHYPQKGFYSQTMYLDKTYLKVVEPLSFNWNIISGKTQTIQGYKCSKAETKFAGREYVAWFTTEIPVSDGPYKFCGLPGLIIKISDKKSQHSYLLISIKRVKTPLPVIFKDNNYTTISSVDFVKAFLKHNAQLYRRFSMDEHIEFNDDETKVRALNKLKARNNFIELY